MEAQTENVEAQPEVETEAAEPTLAAVEGESAQQDDYVAPGNEATETPETICQESVKQMREIDQETAIATEKGWHRVGRFYLKITSPLGEEELAADAKSLAAVLREIENEEEDKKTYNDAANKKIKRLMAAAMETAKRVNEGNYEDEKYLPAFFDPATKERVYFDPEANEEVKRVPALPEDYQLKIDAKAEDGAQADPVEEGQETSATPVPADPEKVRCENCDGTGKVDRIEGTEGAEICYRCAGSGEVFGDILEAQPEAPAEMEMQG